MMSQDPTSMKAIAERLSHRLANFKLSDGVISTVAARVLIDGLSPSMSVSSRAKG